MFPPDNERSSSPPEPIDPFAHGVFISPEEDAEMETDRAREAYFQHLHDTVDSEDVDMNAGSTEVTDKAAILTQIHKRLFPFLTTESLVSWGRVCSRMRASVEVAIPHMFALDPWLSHVFFPWEVAGIRCMLRDTESIISGSVALQCLLREHLEGVRDVDIYCTAQGVSRWLAYLEHHGFKITQEEEDAYKLTNATTGEPIFDFIGTFQRHGWNSTLQLIVCKSSPIEGVINFHSTGVFTIVTGNHMYCAFPLATLRMMQSLSLRDHFHSSLMPYLRKYAARGWKIVHSASGAEIYGRRCPFPQGPRHFGDSMSLKLPLSPNIQAPPSESVESHYWMMDFAHAERQYFPRITYSIMRSPDLQFFHIVPSKRIAIALQNVLHIRAKESHQKQYQDTALVNIVRALYESPDRE